MTPFIRARVEARLFDVSLRCAAGLARGPLRHAVNPLLAAVARAVRSYRRASRVALRGAALGREWQRLMPSRKLMPITKVEGDTAYGEIRVRCPLRGTGDVHACHRLMAYDRALMRPVGARFVVLASQAQPGVETCRVAMRPLHLSADDLVPAHRLARAPVRASETKRN